MKTRFAWLLAGSIFTACSYTLPTVDNSILCGNGDVSDDELCDDGNAINGDGCDSNCTPTDCGNLIVSPEETCDDGNENDTDYCTNSCFVAICGDGSVKISEECDDGNTVSGDGCDVGCIATRCGNSITAGPEEECDDGNDAWYDTCSPQCKALDGTSECGNGITEQNEVCDDTNGVNGDACNATCTVNGVSTIFVGSPNQRGFTDGVGQSALVSGSEYLAIWGDKLYLAANETVRVIDIPTKQITTIAGKAAEPNYIDDSTGANARFRELRGITTDGKTIWVADVDNHVIRAIEARPPHKVTTIAGVPEINSDYIPIMDGPANEARIDTPRGLTFVNGIVYFVEDRAHVLRSYDPILKKVATLAGTTTVPGGTDGIGAAASFNGPRHMTTNGTSLLYIADTYGSKLRSFDIANNQVTTIAGTGGCGYSDGSPLVAQLHRPRGIAFDGQSLYFTENTAHTIRQLEFGKNVSTFSGFALPCAATCSCPNNPSMPGGYMEGNPTDARWNSPYEIVFHARSRSFFVSDSANYLIRRIQ